MSNGTRRLLGAVVAALVAAYAAATTYLELDPSSLALSADFILVGEVSGSESELRDGDPWTTVTFAVEEWLLHAPGEDGRNDDAPSGAEEAPARLELAFLGGEAGDERLVVAGIPTFEVGERLLLFALAQPGLASPVVGVNQGAFSLDARGARAADGRYLSAREGGLALTEDGSPLDELLVSVEQLLELGVAPAPSPGDPDADASAEAPPTGAAPSEEDAEDGTAAEANERENGEEDAAARSPEELPAGEAGARPLEVAYEVREGGATRGLAEAVADAAAVWEEASGGTLKFTAEPNAPEEPLVRLNRIGYGEPELFGPSALSFSLVRSGESGAELLLSPFADSHLHSVLLHELGVLAGLPEGGDGVMSSAISDAALKPTSADLAALEDLRAHPPEDINRDGVVDFYDLMELAAAYGKSGVNLPADINGDGTVDAADLALLEAAYTFTPPAEEAPSGGPEGAEGEPRRR